MSLESFMLKDEVNEVEYVASIDLKIKMEMLKNGN